MLNTIIELCGGLKKGLHNMLSSLIWIDIQNCWHYEKLTS
jgi:hypothetical protein